MRCTPEFLAALRRHHENPAISERATARLFGIAADTVKRIAAQEGWVRPPPPPRDLEPSMRLYEEAVALERRFYAEKGLPPPDDDADRPPRIPVARYTPALIAALKRRYEETQTPVGTIAWELGVHERTLRGIAKKRGWKRPPARRLDLEPAAKLLEEVTALEERVFGKPR